MECGSKVHPEVNPEVSQRRARGAREGSRESQGILRCIRGVSVSPEPAWPRCSQVVTLMQLLDVASSMELTYLMRRGPSLNEAYLLVCVGRGRGGVPCTSHAEPGSPPPPSPPHWPCPAARGRGAATYSCAHRSTRCSGKQRESQTELQMRSARQSWTGC